MNPDLAPCLFSPAPPSGFEALIDASQRAATEDRHDEGADLARQALAVPGLNAAQKARADTLLATHAMRLDDHETAVRHGELALEHLVACGDLAAQSRMHCTLVLSYNHCQLMQQALRHVTAALACARACGDRLAECWALNRAAIVYESTGDARRAVEEGRQALAMARVLGDADATFASLNNLGMMGIELATVLCGLPARSSLVVLRDAPRNDAARAVLLQTLADVEEAVALARAIANPFREALARSNAVAVLHALGRIDEAAEQAETVLAIAQRNDHRFLKQSARFDLAQLHDALGRSDEAASACEALVPEVDTRSHPLLAIQLHTQLHQMHKRAGRFAPALTHHEALLALKLKQQDENAGLQARILLNRLELDQMRHQAERSKLDAEMQRMRAETLDREAHTDPLTGLLNRRFLDRQMPRLMARAADRCLPLSAAIIDIDHFKRVNDTHGHAVGDRVLVELAMRLKDTVRGSDLAVRLGGEEFLLLMPDTPAGDAEEACERLRASLQHHPWTHLAPELSCTVSIGVGHLQPAEDMHRWLARIDAALYRAKHGGRNRVVAAALTAGVGVGVGGGVGGGGGGGGDVAGIGNGAAAVGQAVPRTG